MSHYLKKYELVCEKSATYTISSRASSPQNIADILTRSIRVDRYMTEHFQVIALNNKMDVIGYHDISIGTVDSTQVHPREVFQAAISTPKCAAIIVSHNHPSGDPAPSREDIETTKRLREAGELLGIPVIDHIITGENMYYSFRENDMLFTFTPPACRSRGKSSMCSLR